MLEECCYENCDFEERAEFSESYGWERVGEGLCEVSNLDLVDVKQGQVIIMSVVVILADMSPVNARVQKIQNGGRS